VLARLNAPTARESVFLGKRRSNVYDSSAIGLRCVAGRAVERYYRFICSAVAGTIPSGTGCPG